MFDSAEKNALLTVTNFKAKGMPEAVSLQLKANDICMVSGPSGTGKSQFLKGLADLISHEGAVQLEQGTLAHTAPYIWRAQVMYFPAETAWWDDVVALHFETLPTAERLQEIGLEADLLDANPDTLSSGEKQRLALLRGLQYQPKVLLLDEITANLDPKSEQMVEALLTDYIAQHSAAAFWISHDPTQTNRLATQTCVFSNQHVQRDKRTQAEDVTT